MKAIALFNDVNPINEHSNPFLEIVSLSKCEQEPEKTGANRLEHALANNRALFGRQSREVFLELLNRRRLPVTARQ